MDAIHGCDAVCKRFNSQEAIRVWLKPPKARTCECRYCKGETVEIGRLMGDQTNRIVQMAERTYSFFGGLRPVGPYFSIVAFHSVKGNGSKDGASAIGIASNFRGAKGDNDEVNSGQVSIYLFIET